MSLFGKTGRKARDGEDRLWSPREGTAIFSKPETRHQKSLNFVSQVSPWHLLPQPRTHHPPSPHSVSQIISHPPLTAESPPSLQSSITKSAAPTLASPEGGDGFLRPVRWPSYGAAACQGHSGC